MPKEVEDLVVRMARENAGWGYDGIAGALANIGHDLSDETVGNILRKQIKNGCNRWHIKPRRMNGAGFMVAVTCCMIAIPSSAPHSSLRYEERE